MFIWQASDWSTGEEFCRYARLLAARGYVYNTLGNIALRIRHEHDPLYGVLFTKHKGISLEEMSPENVVVTDIPAGRLLHGDIEPSIGNKLSREIFLCRPDINAVIHLHINQSISFFVGTGLQVFPYISIDAPVVMGKDVYILHEDLNVEADTAPVKDFIQETNCFVMPNHGITTLGRNLSEAYHRMNTMAAEIGRVVEAMKIAALVGREVRYISEVEKRYLYGAAEAILQSPATELQLSR